MIKETLFKYLLVGTAGLLLLSLGGNAWLFGARDDALSDLAKVSTQRDNAVSAAQTCSDSVEKLAKDAEDAKVLHASNVAAAKKLEVVQQSKAQTILAKPPSKPGNDCGSAQDLAIDWLKGRTK